jgi:hypothetical protein
MNGMIRYAMQRSCFGIKPAAFENSREAAPQQKPRYPAPFFSASLISGPDQVARFQMFQKFCDVLLDLCTGYLEFLFEGGGNLVGRILLL